MEKRMATFWSIKIVVILAIFAQIFLPATYLKVLASTKNVDKEECIGKYQIDNVTRFRYSRMQIKFKDLDKTPTGSTIENNGHILKIDLSYSTVPTMEVNLLALGVVGTFRLDFLYFQWFKTAPESLYYKKVSFPAQLHAVFYDENARSFDNALVLDKKIIVLAFVMAVHPTQFIFFDVLKDNLKYVRLPNSETAIDNVNLNYWNYSVVPKYLKYFAYEGSFSEFSCQGTIIWIDLHYSLVITPETVDEFHELKANDFDPLMGQVREFQKPKGTVFMNKESTDGAKKNIPAMPGLIIGVLFLIFYSC